ncbi:hypothetical protein TrRE_jg8152 [Triparma retinervis]|uniref:Uncharacterized protein n=1 Tax=Triparma retinervis TaxID=2557542 RepID=A0A9W7DV76_9STRA|nr:hypothetical protein TrRE_jg8152 [Triparma retinervis]
MTVRFILLSLLLAPLFSSSEPLSCLTSETSSESSDSGLLTGNDLCLSSTEAIALDDSTSSCEQGTHVCVSATFSDFVAAGCVAIDDAETLQTVANQLCSEDPLCASSNPNGASSFDSCTSDDCNTCVPYDSGEAGDDSTGGDSTGGALLSCNTLTSTSESIETSGITDLDVCLPSSVAFTADGEEEACRMGTHTCVSVGYNNGFFAGGCVNIEEIEEIKAIIELTCAFDEECAAENPSGSGFFEVCWTDNCNNCEPFYGPVTASDAPTDAPTDSPTAEGGTDAPTEEGSGDEAAATHSFVL